MARYTVVAGNIGTVYDGFDAKKASDYFGTYRASSIARVGRVAGESVTLYKDGEPFEEYLGPADDEAPSMEDE